MSEKEEMKGETAVDPEIEQMFGYKDIGTTTFTKKAYEDCVVHGKIIDAGVIRGLDLENYISAVEIRAVQAYKMLDDINNLYALREDGKVDIWENRISKLIGNEVYDITENLLNPPLPIKYEGGPTRTVPVKEIDSDIKKYLGCTPSWDPNTGKSIDVLPTGQRIEY